MPRAKMKGDRDSQMKPTFSIGWDVGAWNCDKNSKSRDAIVILDSMRAMVGQPWRGNLRECIAAANTTGDWLGALFAKCEANYPAGTAAVTMAIDTPLGFPDAFVGLITGRGPVEPHATSGLNSYLYRSSERHLYERGLRPLSAIKDMIGSQATKGMHALSKFAPRVESSGVWTDGQCFHAIETYPTACRDHSVIKGLKKGYPKFKYDDIEDAHTCALVAHLFATERNVLEKPTRDIPSHEGWIWTLAPAR